MAGLKENRQLNRSSLTFDEFREYIPDLDALRVHSVQLVVQLFGCVLQGLLLNLSAVDTVAHSAYAAVSDIVER